MILEYIWLTYEGSLNNSTYKHKCDLPLEDDATQENATSTAC